MSLVLPDLTLTLDTDAGVFSPDRVDPATKLLLIETVDAHPPARLRPDPDAGPHVLDLGCGYGPIAITLASRFPGATIWAVDSNERALDLCRRNAERHGLTNVQVRPAAADDPLAGLPAEVRLAGVWSNPPVRIGKAPMTALVTAALDRMAPGAVAHLVVHKHLGADSLHRALTERGWTVRRRRSRRGIRLLEITRSIDEEHPSPDPAGGRP